MDEFRVTHLCGKKAKLIIGDVTKEITFEFGSVQPNDGGMVGEPFSPPKHCAILARLSAPIEDTKGAKLVLDDDSTFEVRVEGGRYLTGVMKSDWPAVPRPGFIIGT